MSYPIQQLAIIAPILFIVLVAVCPIIGFFGGWKRAAYWGGGNLLFYLAGVITWRLAGATIAELVAPMIYNLLQEYVPSSIELNQLTNALIPPIFFLIVVAAGNLLLVINYYAWFKRVSGISADIKIKKAVKFNKWAAKKEGNKQANTAVEIQTQKGVVLKSKTNKQKIINGAVGAVAMTALMLPGTITFTNAVFYATTTSSTRSAAGYEWVNNVYNAFDKLDKKMGWFSYYNGETGDAFNSLLSGLQLSNQTVEETYVLTDPNNVDPVTGEELPLINPVTKEEVVIEKGTSVLTIVTEDIPTVIPQMAATLPEVVNKSKIKGNFDSAVATYQAQGKSEDVAKAAATADINKALGEAVIPVNYIAQTWNALVKVCEPQLQAIFNSSAVTDLINQFISKQETSSNDGGISLTINDAIMTTLFGEYDATSQTRKREEGLFDSIVNDYKKGETNNVSTINVHFTWGGIQYDFSFKITFIKHLLIKASAINNIKALAYKYIKFGDDIKPCDEALFDEAVESVIGLILQESK